MYTVFDLGAPVFKQDKVIRSRELQLFIANLCLNLIIPGGVTFFILINNLGNCNFW